MLTRPDSIAWIGGIFLVIVITIGFGVTDMTESLASDPIHEDFFIDAYSQAESQSGIAGAGSDATEALSGEEGTNTEANEESILTEGFQALLNLGKVWNSAKQSMISGSGFIGLDPIYWIIGVALLAVTFGVIVYTWIRGR